MRAPSDAASRDKILFHLKTKGPRTAIWLAERLSITPVGARQHLHQLAGDGLVEVDETPRVARSAAGRPAQSWRLTEAARAEFPDNHADLTTELIAAATQAFGPKGVARLVRARTKEQEHRYRAALPGADAPLVQRVAALARVRDGEGYMAEAAKQRDGSVLLIENHCPICIAARACTGLCAEELELFQRLMGKRVEVQRTEHLLAGERRCAYRFASI